MRTPSFFDIKTQVRIINACCVLHNFIRIEQASDAVLEDQDSRFLAAIDLEILNRQTPDDTNDRITCVQATEQWTNFRDTFALKMFEEYQARHGPNP